MISIMWLVDCCKVKFESRPDRKVARLKLSCVVNIKSSRRDS